jgi:hypothetical protein
VKIIKTIWKCPKRHILVNQSPTISLRPIYKFYPFYTNIRQYEILESSYLLKPSTNLGIKQPQHLLYIRNFNYSYAFQLLFTLQWDYSLHRLYIYWIKCWSNIVLDLSLTERALSSKIYLDNLSLPSILWLKVLYGTKFVP